MEKFHCDLSDLKNAVRQTGRHGLWKNLDNGGSQFSAEGLFLNFWPSTGTLQLQGQNAVGFDRELIRARALAAEAQLLDLRDENKKLRRKLRRAESDS